MFVWSALIMKLILGLKLVWQMLINTLDRSSELQVWQRRDRQGRPSGWCAYDPKTGQTRYFGSELEIRLWLD
jgi:hypothetical protein